MDVPQGLVFIFYMFVAFFAIGTILKGFFQVRTAEAVVIQRMGKFLRVATAGINFKLPWLDQIAGRIDLRVQQLALDVCAIARGAAVEVGLVGLEQVAVGVAGGETRERQEGGHVGARVDT